MNIKDFKIGQKVYICKMNRGYNRPPEITERTVKKIGRKYLALEGAWEEKFYSADYFHEGLIESVECGDKDYLFPSRVAAEEYIEKENLERWLSCLSAYGKYSLEQLREVKKILEEQED